MKISLTIAAAVLLFPALAFADPATDRQDIKKVTVAITTQAAAYDANDNVGGLLTFDSLTCSTGRYGFVIGAIITDKDKQAVTYDVLLFNANPDASTFTQNAAINIAAADQAKQEPFFQILSTDRADTAGTGIGSLAGLRSVLKSETAGTDGGKVYVAIRTLGTPTYTSTSALTLTLYYLCA